MPTTLLPLSILGSTAPSMTLASFEIQGRVSYFIVRKLMNHPDFESLANCTTHTLPFFLVWDEALPLKPLPQQPYPGKGIPGEKVIFNYRLSSDRRIDRKSLRQTRTKMKNFAYFYSNQC